jgi:hypothetical protein
VLDILFEPTNVTVLQICFYFRRTVGLRELFAAAVGKRMMSERLISTARGLCLPEFLKYLMYYLSYLTYQVLCICHFILFCHCILSLFTVNHTRKSQHTVIQPNHICRKYIRTPPQCRLGRESVFESICNAFALRN